MVGTVDTGLRYWHHGIAIGDGEIVDFGGGTLLDKGATEVRCVALDTFQMGCAAQVVEHPITHRGTTYSEMLPREEIVDRAIWLCANQPPTYRLGYRNCESVAIWCATGDFESFQIKRLIGHKTWLVTPVVAYTLPRKPKVGVPLGIASILFSTATAVPYIHSRAFFDHTRAYPGLGMW